MIFALCNITRQTLCVFAMKNGRQRAIFPGGGMSSPHEYRSDSRPALLCSFALPDVLAAPLI